MRVLILDNYDSFTYNLFHLLEAVAEDSTQIDVFQNDQIDLEAVESYDKIILSPGPGLPKDAGIMMALLEKYHKHKSILGVCLGLQGIAEFFCCKLMNLPNVFHGQSTKILIKKNDALFAGLPLSFNVGRYHSWVVDSKTMSDDFYVTAEDEQGLVMAASHKKFNVCGVQFHPESILSEFGKEIMVNWLKK